MSVLVGMNFYPATGDAGRRQQGAIDALRRLPEATVVNLQWPDARFDVEGIRTLPVLRRDSRRATGRDGRRKPIVSEILHALAREAEAAGCRYFLFANADIEITAEALAYVERQSRDGYALLRTDFDAATKRPLGLMDSGTDAFVFAVDWWQRHAHRFRPYIAGEPVWDNVYTAVLLVHSNAELVQRSGLVLHERHDAPWRNSPFDEYTWLLAALDRPYFSLWAAFHAELVQRREEAPSPEELHGLRERVFTAAALRHGRLLQLGRVVKAHARYAMRRRRSG